MEVGFPQIFEVELDKRNDYIKKVVLKPNTILFFLFFKSRRGHYLEAN
jgi:hypothetical protein|tara:strand:+ start:1325 stop:1468 length:144 start_codon:yes stop_codon:yes gene_type:complete